MNTQTYVGDRIAEVNIKAAIAVFIAAIAFLILYIAFFK